MLSIPPTYILGGKYRRWNSFVEDLQKYHWKRPLNRHLGVLVEYSFANKKWILVEHPIIYTKYSYFTYQKKTFYLISEMLEKVPPIMTEKTISITARLDDDIVIPCSAYANPSPIYRWVCSFFSIELFFHIIEWVGETVCNWSEFDLMRKWRSTLDVVVR